MCLCLSLRDHGASQPIGGWVALKQRQRSKANGGGGLTGILVGQFVAVRKVGQIAGPLLRICHWRGHQEKGTKNGKSGNLSGPEKICIFKCRWLDFRHF